MCRPRAAAAARGSKAPASGPPFATFAFCRFAFVRDGDASAAFTDCRAFGDVRAANSSHVGGFVGYTYRPVGCTNCVATGRVSGRGATGGLVGYCGGGVRFYRIPVRPYLSPGWAKW